MAGRPPEIPRKESSGFSQGWTTTAPRSNSWRRSQSQSTTALRMCRPGSPDTNQIQPIEQPNFNASATMWGAYPAVHSERLRGAGEQVVNTPPRKPSSGLSSESERGRSVDRSSEHDVHADCRLRISTLTSELAEAASGLKAMQRDHERILRQMGNEREDFRLLTKRHSGAEQEVSSLHDELHRYRDEMSSMRDGLKDEMSYMREAHGQHTARMKSWEEAEAHMASNLRIALQASEESEQHAHSALRAQKLASTITEEEMQAMKRSHEDALRSHQHDERHAMELRASSKEKECRFAELQSQVAKLQGRCAEQDDALRDKTSEFNDMASEYAASSTTESRLRCELEQYRDNIAGELNTALAETRAAEEENTKRIVSEYCAERDEARQHAQKLKRGEDAARNSAKVAERKISSCENAQSESRAMTQRKEQEMQELQSKNAKTATKKEAEIRMLQQQLEQSKTEVVELYDALVRAAENTGKDKRKSTRN